MGDIANINYNYYLLHESNKILKATYCINNNLLFLIIFEATGLDFNKILTVKSAYFLLVNIRQLARQNKNIQYRPIYSYISYFSKQEMYILYILH